MTVKTNNNEVIRRLQQKILRWQGVKPATAHTTRMGLGPVENSFPNGVFPIAGIHEFVCGIPEHAAATYGFVGSLLARLMQDNGICLWISTANTVSPTALKAFGVVPERVIFIDMKHEKGVLWAAEEALKHQGIAVVVAELDRLDFVQSRRLQLAVEKSQATGLILRRSPVQAGSTACVARWQISPIPSMPEPGMPGIGMPRWQVKLLKVRNGQPGSWILEWRAGQFAAINQTETQTEEMIRPHRKLG